MAMAIRIDPETRKRVERIWREWNKQADAAEHAMPVLSKAQLYAALLSWGAAEYERVLELRAPRGADEFTSGGPGPFAKRRGKAKRGR
jgi:hypothetical protein